MNSFCSHHPSVGVHDDNNVFTLILYKPLQLEANTFGIFVHLHAWGTSERRLAGA